MHYSACDSCNRLFVIRHRPSPPRRCPKCRQSLRSADCAELVARFQASKSAAAYLSPAIYDAVANLPLISLDHPADR